MISEELDQALSGEQDESKFAIALEGVLAEIHSEEFTPFLPSQVIGARLSNIKHPLVEALLELAEWYGEGIYPEGAAEGTTSLDRTIMDLTWRDWPNTATQCYTEKIRLLSSLAGHSPADTVTEALDYLFSNGRKPMVGPLHMQSLVEEIIDQEDEVDSRDLRRALEWCSSRATRLHTDGALPQEERVLQLGYKIAGILGDDHEKEDLGNRIIRCIDAQVSQHPDPLAASGILSDAIANYHDILTTQQQEEWAERVRSLNQKGELSQLPFTIDATKIREAAKIFIERYQSIRANSEPGTALIRSFNWDDMLPDYDSAVSLMQRNPVRAIFSRHIQDREHLTIANQPGGLDTDGQVPPNYLQMMQLSNLVLTEALRQLLQQGELTAGHFYLALNNLPVNEHDHAFLTHAIYRFSEGDHISAFHIVNNRFEGVLRRVLQANGYSVTTITDGVTQSKTLGELITEVENADEQLGKYLRYRYADRNGNNWRNITAHSKLQVRDVNHTSTALYLYDVLRAGHRINTLHE